MNPEKSLLSSFSPKKPSDELKQRVLNAATGAAQEPYTYEPFFGKLDWGLLAASIILAAALALLSGNGAASHGNEGDRTPELSAARTASIKELDIPGAPRRPARSEIEKAAELMKDFGG